MVSGAVLGMLSWWLKPRISGNPWAWGVACCSILMFAQVRVMHGSSGYDGADTVALLFVVAFWCAIIPIAIRTGESRGRKRATAA